MERSNLKKDNLSMLETIAMSVAIVAPTASMSLNVPLMTQTAGFSSPFIFFVSMIVVGFVSYSIIKFNQYFSSAGSLYTFTKKSLGKKMGFTSGWTLLLAYMMLVAGCTAGLGTFCSSLLNVFGIHIAWLPLSLIFSIVMIFVGITDAKISTRIMLIMEGISIMLILILSVVIIYKVATTTGLSSVPFKTNGNKMSSIASTSVLAFLAFIGFESASSLGEETKNPKKYIPIAIISAVFVTGSFYLLSSYSQVVGFGISSEGLKELSASSLPLTYLADKFISKTYGTFLILSAVLSFFSCSLGAACAGARMLFSMGRDGIMHRSMKKLHHKYSTPYVALILIIVVSMVIQVSMFYKEGTEVFEYCATIGSLAILVSYLFTSIGSIVYFTRNKIWSKVHLAMPVLSILVLMYVLVANICPIPQFPNNLFPYIVLGWIALGFILEHKFKQHVDEKIVVDDKIDGVTENIV
ncbi:APC family permease [Clostridium sp. Mt-5]|uniref:APC family permease n=1 Tax=Clostridium moutaii TaxID=3240932 RepID=A0ABV4BSZ8_9CLOT